MSRVVFGAAFAAAAFSPLGFAQVCPGDPTTVLQVAPTDVPIGTAFDVTVTAPVGNLVVLFVATQPGPTATPYGSLCVGLPAGTFAFVQPLPTITFPHPIECRPEYVGLTGYLQFLAADPFLGEASTKISNSVQVNLIGGACGTSEIEAGDFVSFTMGGWGTKCSGNNPGCLRDAWFPTAFPQGLLIGDADGLDGDDSFAALFTNSKAIADYLPAGKTPGALNKDLTNPKSTSAGVLGGQLVAAKLNVGFDAAGAFDAIKDLDGAKLGDLVFVANVHAKLLGLTVSEVILLADNAISGVAAMPLDVDGDAIGDVSFSDLANALDRVNNEFVGGAQALGSLGFGVP
jgi:hypothetical protein